MRSLSLIELSVCFALHPMPRYMVQVGIEVAERR